jgi:hypothetical protein
VAKETLYCSFCGKSQHEVKKLIAGPATFICNECVELCIDIVGENAREEQAVSAVDISLMLDLEKKTPPPPPPPFSADELCKEVLLGADASQVTAVHFVALCIRRMKEYMNTHYAADIARARTEYAQARAALEAQEETLRLHIAARAVCEEKFRQQFPFADLYEDT